MSEENRTAMIRQRVEKYYKARSELATHAVIYILVNVMLWVLWALLGLGSFPWPGLVMLAWGSGLAANWLEVRFKAPQYFIALERSVAAQMARVYGPDWDTIADAGDYQRVFKAVEKATKERQEFAIHLAIFVIINLMLWFLWAAIRDTVTFPFPLLVMGFWGIGLGAHASDTFFSSARQQLAHEENIAREVERWSGAAPAVKKKKRAGARLELGDDGELIEIVDDDWGVDEQSQQGGIK